MVRNTTTAIRRFAAPGHDGGMCPVLVSFEESTARIPQDAGALASGQPNLEELRDRLDRIVQAAFEQRHRVVIDFDVGSAPDFVVGCECIAEDFRWLWHARIHCQADLAAARCIEKVLND